MHVHDVLSHRLLGCLAFETYPLAKVPRSFLGEAMPRKQQPSAADVGIDAISSEEAM